MTSGGAKPVIELPLMIFKNKNRNYPIKGVPDDVQGTAHRTGPNGWMDKTIMKQWICEPRFIKKLPNHRMCHLFVEKCSRHNLEEEIVGYSEYIMTIIYLFFPNATDLI